MTTPLMSVASFAVELFWGACCTVVQADTPRGDEYVSDLLTYRQTTFVAPVGEAPAGRPAWLREAAPGVAEYLVKNTGAEPSSVRLALYFAPEQDATKSVRYQEVREGVVVTSGDRILAFLDKRWSARLSCEIAATGTVRSGTLPVGGEESCSVYIPRVEG